MEELNTNVIESEPDTAVPETTETVKTPNYRKLYRDKCEELKVAENKINELQQICRALTEQKNFAENKLKQATLEYNTRVQYVLDVIKHAYLSTQFAISASKKESTHD